MSLETYWLEWGVYVAFVNESGTGFGSTSLNWGAVEYQNGGRYGPGLGLIQLTSNAHNFLNQCAQNGGDTSNCPDTDFKNLLDTGSVGLEYTQPSCYSNQLGEWLKNDFLVQANNIEIQKQYIKNFFETGVAGEAINNIRNNVTDSQTAVFLTRLVVWAPSWVVLTASIPAPSNINEAYNQMMINSKYTGAYVLDPLRSLLLSNSMNISEPPPVNVISGDSNDTTPVEKIPPSNGLDTEGKAPLQPTENQSNSRILKVEAGDVLKILNNQIVTIGKDSKFMRIASYIIPQIINEEEAVNNADKTLDNSESIGSGVNAPQAEQAKPSTSSLKFNELKNIFANGNGVNLDMTVTPAIKYSTADLYNPNVPANPQQCYALAKWWAYIHGYPLMTTASANMSNPAGYTPGLGAKWIGYDFSWQVADTPWEQGVGIINPSLEDVQAGDIVTFNSNNPDGHVGVMGDDGLFYQQNVLIGGYYQPTTAFSLSQTMQMAGSINSLVRLKNLT